MFGAFDLSCFPFFEGELDDVEIPLVVDIQPATAHIRDDETALSVIAAAGGINSIARTFTTSLVLIIALAVVAVVMELVLNSGV